MLYWYCNSSILKQTIRPIWSGNGVILHQCSATSIDFEILLQHWFVNCAYKLEKYPEFHKALQYF